MDKTHSARADGIVTRVGNATAPDGQTGIGFAVLDGAVIVSITMNGVGLVAELAGDDIDAAAGILADAVIEATRAEMPSLRGVQ